MRASSASLRSSSGANGRAISRKMPVERGLGIASPGCAVWHADLLEIGAQRGDRASAAARSRRAARRAAPASDTQRPGAARGRAARRCAPACPRASRSGAGGRSRGSRRWWPPPDRGVNVSSTNSSLSAVKRLDRSRSCLPAGDAEGPRAAMRGGLPECWTASVLRQIRVTLAACLPLRPGDHIELDAIALRQGPEAIAQDRGEVDEDVLAAVVVDEAEALRLVEPLHRALARGPSLRPRRRRGGAGAAAAAGARRHRRPAAPLAAAALACRLAAPGSSRGSRPAGPPVGWNGTWVSVPQFGAHRGEHRLRAHRRAPRPPRRRGAVPPRAAARPLRASRQRLQRVGAFVRPVRRGRTPARPTVKRNSSPQSTHLMRLVFAGSHESPTAS